MTSANANGRAKTKPSSRRTKSAKSLTVAGGGNGKRGAKAKYNYELAKERFVEGWPKDLDNPDGDRDWFNMRELSERLDIPYERVREKAAQQRWTDLKVQYTARLTRERQSLRAEKLANDAVSFDDTSLNIAKAGMKLIQVRLAEIGRDVNEMGPLREDALRRRAAGMPVERHELWSAIRIEDLERLARAFQSFQDGGMKALGTDVDRHTIEATINGGVEVGMSVSAELERDDPDRLGAFMATLSRAGLLDRVLDNANGEEDEPPASEATVNGEVLLDVNNAGTNGHKSN